jgi:hypothetical protein
MEWIEKKRRKKTHTHTRMEWKWVCQLRNSRAFTVIIFGHSVLIWHHFFNNNKKTTAGNRFFLYFSFLLCQVSIEGPKKSPRGSFIGWEPRLMKRRSLVQIPHPVLMWTCQKKKGGPKKDHNKCSSVSLVNCPIL